MCGIIGVIGRCAPAAPILLEALGRLEYRGYDSAGIATLINGDIVRRRTAGKLAKLREVLKLMPLAGTIGIGHTRWATHGAPTAANAHPHATARVAVVHNGIIENHAALRSELEARGQVFSSDTDTETVVHLLDWHLQAGLTPAAAVAASVARLAGSYALAIIFAGHPKLMIGVRHGAPLVVGFGTGEMLLGSDALALAPLTRRISYLADGEWAVLDGVSARFFDAAGREQPREIRFASVSGAAIDKGGFRHYMEKELHEHPLALSATAHSVIDPDTHLVRMPDLPVALAEVSRVTMSACGSAYYAALVGRYWFERLARLPADPDVASEFRYRTPPLPLGGLGVLVSQSGETADTLAALRYLRTAGQAVLAVVNVVDSAMAREADAVLFTRAGPEIGVASTKAFTTQLVVLAALALAAARARGQLSAERETALGGALLAAPSAAAAVLANQARILALARRIVPARDVLYLGRGDMFPIALEGALKLKEISYIHAEGYAAGEMKHGPIALIDKTVPVIALAPSGPLFEKTASNLQEAAARGGQVMLFSDAEGAARLSHITTETVVIPAHDPLVAPIVYAVAVQLLAYHVAVLKGTDVDQPRNLAKSVTVE